MKFLVLAYGDGKDLEALTESQRAEVFAQDELLRKRGDLVAVVEGPTVVRSWNGTPDVSRGPFARGGRPMVGFGIIEARDLEEAIGLVAKTPCAVAKGAVEVWPVRS